MSYTVTLRHCSTLASPKIWKIATLVLIPKPEKKNLGVLASFYLFICLINEAGKMLEKIVAGGLWNYFNQKGLNISDDQYFVRFRVGRSTIEAIVISLAHLAMSRMGGGGSSLGGVIRHCQCLQLPPIQDKMKQALLRHRIPTYLRSVIGDYLSDRAVLYSASMDRGLIRWEISRRVPQACCYRI